MGRHRTAGLGRGQDIDRRRCGLSLPSRGDIVSQAWFSVSQDEAVTGRGVVFEYPLDGGNRMFRRGYDQTPTPGTLLEGQVPETPIELSADTEPPVITYIPAAGTQPVQDLTLTASVADSQKIKQVNLYYKRTAQATIPV